MIARQNLHVDQYVEELISLQPSPILPGRGTLSNLIKALGQREVLALMISCTACQRLR